MEKIRKKGPCWWCICASARVKIRGSQVSWTFSFSTEWNCICIFFSTEMPLTLDSFPQSWMTDRSRERCRGEGWLRNGMGARWRQISSCFLSSLSYSCPAPRALAVPAHRALPWPRTTCQPLADTWCYGRVGLQLPTVLTSHGPHKARPTRMASAHLHPQGCAKYPALGLPWWPPGLLLSRGGTGPWRVP